MIIFVRASIDLLDTAVKDTELKRKKAEALYSVYRTGLIEGRFDSLFGAGRYCARQEAPCFFISAKQASLLMGRIFSFTSLINLNTSQRKMAWRLYADYMRYLEEHPQNTLSRERVMEILVDQPAPEFYISGDGARRILRGEIMRTRRKMGW